MEGSGGCKIYCCIIRLTDIFARELPIVLRKRVEVSRWGIVKRGEIQESILERFSRFNKNICVIVLKSMSSKKDTRAIYLEDCDKIITLYISVPV